MKKTLAVLLALAMVFSTVTFAFAEGTISADAQACATLGMLKGDTSAGVTADYVAQAPTRLTAAILFLRLKGLENAALAYTGTENFADADQVNWAGGKAILGYLKTHPELGWVGDQGKFNPNGLITAQAYYKVMLETLGYKQNTPEVIGDFTYAGVIEFAGKAGLTKVATVTNFTVNDVAIATVEALKAKVKGTEKTLAVSLVDAKVLTEANAIAAGVYTVAPVTFAVDSVSTDNLAQLTVKFNKELKAAGDEDNYSLETSGAAVLDEDSNFTLLADKKTVVITLTHSSAQQENVDLTINGIEAADGSKLAKTVIEDVQLFDKTIPSAVGAKVVGNDTIKVTFSEPMNPAETTAADFKVDGGEIIVKGVTLVNNNTEANVELYSTLDNDKVKIEVGTAAKDFAGFGTPKKAFDLEVVKDTTAPVVVGYEDATPTGVTLIFDQDIQLVDATADQENFYHTNTANYVDADITPADIDGNKLTLSFENNKLPEGTAYIYVAKEMVADLWDNENAKVAYTVQVTLDKTKPTLTKVEAGSTERELVLTFSEDLDTTGTAEDTENYTILDKDGKVVENVISAAALDEDAVTITFVDDMTGNYSIVVDNVEDKAGNAIEKVTKAFNISDVTAPLFSDFSAKLYNPGTEDQLLKVSFGEAMAIDGKYSVVDLDKYTLDSITLGEFDGATIKAVDGNKGVEIALPYDADNEDTYSFADTDELVVARVADAANNKTELLADTVTLDPAGTVGIDTVELTSKNTVVVTLLDKLTKFVAADFTLTQGVTPVEVSRVRHTINSDGVSVVTFTLAEDVATDAEDITVTTADTASENIYGELLEEDAVVDVDKAAPTVASYTFMDNGTIEVVFSEALDPDTFAVSSKNGFSIAGGKLSTVAFDGDKTVTLTSTGAAGEQFTRNTNVYYTSVFGIKDMNGNKLGDINRTDALDIEE